LFGGFADECFDLVRKLRLTGLALSRLAFGWTEINRRLFRHRSLRPWLRSLARNAFALLARLRQPNRNSLLAALDLTASAALRCAAIVTPHLELDVA
jgi:hypothetical protein